MDFPEIPWEGGGGGGGGLVSPLLGLSQKENVFLHHLIDVTSKDHLMDGTSKDNLMVGLP